MQHARLGSTGLRVSRLCLGCMTYGSPNWRPWVLGEEAARPFIRRAIELGIDFFDTADMYSVGASEEILGRALRDFAKRHEVVIATKIRHAMGDKPNDQGLSRKHIMDGIDASLRRLGTDYVDLYQIHRWDHETPIEETLEALNDVVRAGKARYIGASSMFAWQFAKALHLSGQHGWARFVSMQNHYNLIYREEEREMIPLCLAEGVGLIPWSPLARGWLAGNRRADKSGDTARAQTDEYAREMYEAGDLEVVEAVRSVAAKLGRPMAQVALAWVLGRPGVAAPIIGASRMEHLEDALEALDIALDPADIEAMEAAYRPHRVLGHR